MNPALYFITYYSYFILFCLSFSPFKFYLFFPFEPHKFFISKISLHISLSSATLDHCLSFIALKSLSVMSIGLYFLLVYLFLWFSLLRLLVEFILYLRHATSCRQIHWLLMTVYSCLFTSL